MRTQLKSASVRTFLVIWIGQFVSIIGSTLTGFALGVWVFLGTGRITDFVMVSLFTALPIIFFSPVAGSLIDRYNRRHVMLLADTVAGLSTILIAILLLGNQLEIWHIYLATLLNSSANVFQLPAYSAVVAQLVPKEQLPRANGLVSLADSISRFAAPVIGGFLVGIWGIWSVILIDFVTFVFAITTLLIVRVPDVQPDSQELESESRGVWEDFKTGLKYIRARPSLLALMTFNMIINVIAVSEVLVTPLVLSFTTEQVLGLILGFGALGFFAGSLFMSVWGGFKRLFLGAIAFELVIASFIVFMGSKAGIWSVGLAVFMQNFSYPIIWGSNMTIWQRKVPQHLHGRVLSSRRMLAWMLMPIPILLAGPIVDKILEPMMQVDGLLADTMGRIIGIGTGRGIGLMMVITGSLHFCLTLLALTYKPLREIENMLPDAN